MKKDDRLFAPFPIEMDEHPKIIGLSDAAFRAVFEATFYSRRMLSDGFLDERIVLKRWGQAVVDELTSNDPNRPSWNRVDGGWQIHDFEKHHPVRAEIEAKRADVSARRSESGKRGAQKRWGSKPIANGWQTDGKSVANDSSETETETETTTPKGVVRPTKRKPETILPETWSPSAANSSFAESNGLDLAHEIGQFTAHAAANDRRQRDWDAAFRTWLGNASKWAKPVNPEKKYATADEWRFH